jgi:hypothetical protein
MSAAQPAEPVLERRVRQAVRALTDAGYRAGGNVVPVDGPVVTVYHDGNQLTLRTSGCQWKFGVLVVAESDDELVDGLRGIVGLP